MPRSSSARPRGLDCRLIFEPGRLIVGNAGVLVTRVIYVKRGEAKTFVIVDAAMNDLIRPTLYEAHHEIRPVAEPAPDARRMVADVVGSGLRKRRFSRARPRPAELAAGDLIAVMTAGAYGAVQAGTYNTRPLVPEVLVNGDAMGLGAAARRGRGADRARSAAALAVSAYASAWSRKSAIAIDSPSRPETCTAPGPTAERWRRRGRVVHCCDAESGTENHVTDRLDGPDDPRHSAEGRYAQALMQKALARARGAILWERLWPALAALATAIGLFLVVSWAGLWLMLPPMGRAIGLFAFGILLAAAAVPLLRLAMPTSDEGLKRLDREQSALPTARRPRSPTRWRQIRRSGVEGAVARASGVGGARRAGLARRLAGAAPGCARSACLARARAHPGGRDLLRRRQRAAAAGHRRVRLDRRHRRRRIIASMPGSPRRPIPAVRR